jgi:ubiquinone biosynthesis protein
VLTLLFEITSLFEMTTRIELVMLQKTMVVVEGVARKLDPQLNMWSTAEPVVGAWIAGNLGPVGRIEDAGRILSSVAAFMADGPRRLEQIATRLEARLEADSEHEIAKVIPGLTLRVGFVFVLTGFLLAVLCMAAYRWIF